MESREAQTPAKTCARKGPNSTTKVITICDSKRQAKNQSQKRSKCTLDICNETKAAKFKHPKENISGADSINLLVSEKKNQDTKEVCKNASHG
jgi:hypothetical protein